MANKKFDTVIYVSDNESWAHQPGQAMGQQWGRYKADNPNAKLVCIDLTPNKTPQVNEIEKTSHHRIGAAGLVLAAPFLLRAHNECTR